MGGKLGGPFSELMSISTHYKERLREDQRGKEHMQKRYPALNTRRHLVGDPESATCGHPPKSVEHEKGSGSYKPPLKPEARQEMPPAVFSSHGEGCPAGLGEHLT